MPEDSLTENTDRPRPPAHDHEATVALVMSDQATEEVQQARQTADHCLAYFPILAKKGHAKLGNRRIHIVDEH